MGERFKHKNKDLGDKGQASVEFALTITLLLSFALFYIQLCLIFSWGNFVHYATFMSARAYLAAGPSEEDQQERAKTVIVRMLKKSPGMPGADRFPMIAKADGPSDWNIPGFKVIPPREWGFAPYNRSSSWMEGVRYRFRSRLFWLPFGKAASGNAPAGGSSVNSVTLQSESWLGREPDYESCLREMTRRLGRVIDNGC